MFTPFQTRGPVFLYPLYKKVCICMYAERERDREGEKDRERERDLLPTRK